MARVTRTRRPRYRKERRQSPHLEAFLASMASKWSGHETPVSASAVGSNVVTLGSTPAVHGPFTLRGAPPPELRSIARFWINCDGSHNATIYTSRKALEEKRGAVALASWALTKTFKTLTTTTAVVHTLVAGPVVAPAAVVTAEDTFFSAAHGLATGQLVRLTTATTLPAGLSLATNYWVIAVDADRIAFATSLANALAATKVNITDQGTGNHTVNVCNVDTTTDAMAAAAAHGLNTGDQVQVSTGTTLPSGISAATSYYVVAVSATVLKLADTKAHALAGTNLIDITAIGAGDQTITLVGVDITADAVIIAAHAMQTGDGPVQVSTGGSLPTGLSAATDYYVIRDDDGSISFATSRANALAGTKINLTGLGSGTHTLARALSVGLDLSAAGLLEFLAQGVLQKTMQTADVGDIATVFSKG